MTSSGSECHRASSSSDEDGGDIKKALHDHTLHEVESLAGKTQLFTVMSASGIVVAWRFETVCVHKTFSIVWSR